MIKTRVLARFWLIDTRLSHEADGMRIPFGEVGDQGNLAPHLSVALPLRDLVEPCPEIEVLSVHGDHLLSCPAHHPAAGRWTSGGPGARRRLPSVMRINTASG